VPGISASIHKEVHMKAQRIAGLIVWVSLALLLALLLALAAAAQRPALPGPRAGEAREIQQPQPRSGHAEPGERLSRPLPGEVQAHGPTVATPADRHTGPHEMVSEVPHSAYPPGEQEQRWRDDAARDALLARPGRPPWPAGVAAGPRPSISRGEGLSGVSSTPVITFDVSYGTVTGYTDADSEVYLLLWRGVTQAGEARTRSDAVGYFYVELVDAGRWAEVQPGDTLDVVVGSGTTTLAVPDLTGTVDPATDTVSGTIGGVSLPADLLVDCWGNQVTVTSDGSGHYTASLSSLVDVSWYYRIRVGHKDANGNWLTASFYPQDGLVVETTYPGVSGYTAPGATVTVTVNHGGDLATRSDQADLRDGWWGVNFDDLGAGDVVTAELGGGEVTGTVSALTAGFDLPNDRVTGSGPASSQVSVFTFRREGLRWWYPHRLAATGPSGDYTADFSAVGLDAWNWAGVLHHDTAKADTVIYVDAPLALVEWTWNEVWGYAQPGALVTATLQDGLPLEAVLEVVTATADAADGWYWAGFEEPFQAGDQVAVEGSGLDATVDLVTLTVHLDLAADTLSGQAPPSADLAADTWAWDFGPYFTGQAAAGLDGSYELDLSGVLDVHNGRGSRVRHPQGDDKDQPGWLSDNAYAPYMDLDESHNGLWGRVPEENVPVTLTLKTGGGAVKAVISTQSNAGGDFGWQNFYDGGGNQVDIEPGDQVVLEIAGWSQTAIAPDMAVQVDAATDRVSGTGPADSFVEVYVRDYSPTFRLPTDGGGHFLADFSGLIDIRPGTEAEAAIYDDHWNRLYAVGRAPYARANIMWDAVDGWFGPGVTVWYTITDAFGVKGGGSGVTRPDGWLDGVWCDCDLAPGDQVQVVSDAGFDAVLVPISITGHIDVDADTISGQMAGGDFPGQGNVWVWSDARWDGYGTDFDIAANGSYTVDLGGAFDVWTGDEAEVWYYDANGNQVGTQLYGLRMDVNYAHDWVWAQTVPNAEVDVEVAGKATLHGQAYADGGFGTWDWSWLPANPDIQPGDVVTVTAAGYVASINPVGTITGVADDVENTVSGTINAPWFDVPLRVRCEVWVDNGPPSIYTEADPDGGSYLCDFDDVGFDLQTSQDVAVRYYEPDGNRVINVFQAPFPWTLGEPGLSFRYLDTLGETEVPYFDDAAHLNYPYGLGTDGTNVWIAECQGRRAMKYASSGSYVTQIGRAGVRNASGTTLDCLHDVGVDASGNVWLVDSPHHVVEFDAGGNWLGELGEIWTSGDDNNHFSEPYSIAFDTNGNIYVSDTYNHRIQVFDSGGTYLTTIGLTGNPGTANDQFDEPRHISVDSNNRLYVADAGNHRVQILNVSNPLAITYVGTIGVPGVSGSGTGQLDYPEGVAVDVARSRIYVADSNNDRVQVFNYTTRAYQGTIPNLSYPVDVAVDTASNLYVAEPWTGDNRVLQFNSNLVLVRTLGNINGVPYVTDAYHYNQPSGVAVAPDGSLVVGEYTGQRVVKMKADGTPLWTVGEPGRRGSDNAHFRYVEDVDLDSLGRVYVADGDNCRVQIYNANGSYHATLGTGCGSGDDQFEWPTGVAIGPGNAIYVADGDNQRVQIYDSNRNYLATLGETGVGGSDNAHFDYPRDLEVDAAGNIYVVDQYNHRVQVFDSSRTYVRTIGESGRQGDDFGHLSYPTAVAVDGQGRIYVADGWGYRVEVFDSSGAYLTTVAGSWGNGTADLQNADGLALDASGHLYVADLENARIQKFAPGVPGWVQDNINGFGDWQMMTIRSLTPFGGQLYAGTENWAGLGAQLWRAGSPWTAVVTDGFGVAENFAIDHLIEFKGQIYAGTVNSAGGEVWRSSSGDSLDWTRVVSHGFGDAANVEVFRFAVFDGMLYAATWSYLDHGTEIWRSGSGDSDDWTRVVSDGFDGDAANGAALSFETYNGFLYAGTANWNSGGEVWRTADGTLWTKVNDDGFGSADNGWVSALAAFDGSLYAGAYGATAAGSEIWRCQLCDGSDWALVDSGFGNGDNRGGMALEVFDGYLYATTTNGATGMEVWRSRTGDAGAWRQVGFDGFGDSHSMYGYFDNAMTVFDGRLYTAATNWSSAAKVWQKKPTSTVYLPLLLRNK
jgi:hypothetical protein